SSENRRRPLSGKVLQVALNGGERMATYENKYLTGPSKFLFHQRLKITIALHYLLEVLRGKRSFGQYIRFVRKVLIFYNKIKSNKVVKTRNVYKFHIYFPAFPSPAFYKGMEKFIAECRNPEDIPPTSVLLSMTKACPYNCEHCYQKVDALNDMPVEVMKEVTRKIKDLGASYFNIEGGEPLVRFDRLLEMLSVLGDTEEIWVNTTGFSLTPKKADKMRDSGVFGVMVSLHHPDPAKHDEFVGHGGAFDIAIKALRTFKEAGISTMINCTGTQAVVEDDGFDRIMDLAKGSGCAMVQLIHEKPAGAWMGKDDTMGKKYLSRLHELHRKYNSNNEKTDYPPVSSQAFESRVDEFGCTAGAIERFYVNANGDVQPCEFVNVSFGNVLEEEFEDIYRRMRKRFIDPRTNWICCTEQEKVAEAFRSSGQKNTPLSQKRSAPIIQGFDRGKKTPIYERMGLYERK
ncbi:MAG: radical SAM protein, partial [Candidatus Thermoplasmatota archaeon]|nr:radical SAM protein [Candidatus Thermoplasmatota archaeon]